MNYNTGSATGNRQFQVDPSGLKYTRLPDGTAEIVEYSGKATSISVPASLGGMIVTGIGSGALCNIEENGYTWPLEYIELPDTIKTLGDAPFNSYCTISVSPAHPTLAVIDNVLFHKPTKTLVTYFSNKPGDVYHIPQGIKTIGKNAFFGHNQLSGVVIPSSVNEIGESAFCSCDSLTSVQLSEGLKTIGDSAFQSCRSLTSVSIPASVVSIGAYAFNNCPIASLELREGVVSIGASAFTSARLTSITLPNSVQYLPGNPFDTCHQLTEVRVHQRHPWFAVIDGVLFEKANKRLVCYPKGKPQSSYAIPQGIRIIGEHAFYDCNNLSSVNIPDSVVSLDANCFEACSCMNPAGLRINALPEGLTSIGDEAFRSAGLTTVHIPASVSNIGSKAFASCKNLAEISVHPKNPYYKTLDGCLVEMSAMKLLTYPEGSSLMSYTVPYGVKVIGERAFGAPEQLTSVTLPATVTTIEKYSFGVYSSITSVTIPASVTSIAHHAFPDRDAREFTAYVEANSYAQQFCKDDHVNYVVSASSGNDTQDDPFAWLRS